MLHETNSVQKMDVIKVYIAVLLHMIRNEGLNVQMINTHVVYLG